MFLVPDEAANAFTDFNFDSNVQDRCAFVFEVPSHRLMRLGRSVFDLGKRSPGEPLFDFIGSEAAEATTT